MSARDSSFCIYLLPDDRLMRVLSIISTVRFETSLTLFSNCRDFTSDRRQVAGNYERNDTFFSPVCSDMVSSKVSRYAKKSLIAFLVMLVKFSVLIGTNRCAVMQVSCVVSILTMLP